MLNAGKGDPLLRTACFSYVAFILSIAVGQAFVWDSVGAQIGIWEFNREKCTFSGDTLLPLEEILWLFHHVIKAALWQLKMSEWQLTAGTDGVQPSAMPPALRTAGNTLLAAVALGGVATLLGDVDEYKCLGLIAAFFAPVLAIIFNLGSRYFGSHWRLFASGWLPPGCWTVAIDCVGQQQDVWYFPPKYLTGVATLPNGLLKLDIAAVYLVSTLAVTATGAIILAASEEFASSRQRQQREWQGQEQAAEAEEGGGALATASGGSSSGSSGGGSTITVADPTLWDLGLFIFHGASPEAASLMAKVRPPSASWRMETILQR